MKKTCTVIYMIQGDDFIQTIVHDLKTPISAQICACKILSKNLKNKSECMEKQLAEELLASNKFMLNMVQNILYKYKYTTTAVEIIKSKQDFAKTLLRVLNDLQYLAKSKNVTINFRCKKELIAYYDEIEIIRVLNNLFSNAIDFAPENSKIDVWLFQEGESLFFKISNEAKNVSEEEFNTFFEKYSTSGKKYGKIGHGLGLFVSKEIIEAHGGKISACMNKSSDNSTSIVTFKFILPV